VARFVERQEYCPINIRQNGGLFILSEHILVISQCQEYVPISDPGQEYRPIADKVKIFLLLGIQLTGVMRGILLRIRLIYSC
jgi:hypothetical protein